MTDFRMHPIDETSRERLAAQDLRFALIDTHDTSEDGVAAFDAWLQADMRGFHAERMSDEMLVTNREGLAERRTTGVWDETAAARLEPVATVNSWPAELSVPGGRVATAWAISSVTVSPTHKRRGIARALLEAELRTASALGVPLAMLTVSESVLYGRYGFSPAALGTDWTIETKRARPLTGVPTTGRVEFISLEEFRREVQPLHERVRPERPGEIQVWDLRWDQIASLTKDGESNAKKLRAIRYLDADGATQGVALYKVGGGDEDFTKHTVNLHYLLHATPDAYARLWDFVLDLDLVTEVKAHLRSADEPLRWMLNDFRAARVTVNDHQYVRVLDVPAALTTRTYVEPGRLALEVNDALGFAAGTWLLEVDETGEAVVTAVDAAPEGVPALALTATELAALYLGGVSAVALSAAGRVRELVPGAATAADTILRSPVTPYLSIWY